MALRRSGRRGDGRRQLHGPGDSADSDVDDVACAALLDSVGTSVCSRMLTATFVVGGWALLVPLWLVSLLCCWCCCWVFVCRRTSDGICDLLCCCFGGSRSPNDDDDKRSTRAHQYAPYKLTADGRIGSSRQHAALL